MPLSNIDTDYGIGTILSRFDSEYITMVIQSSIANRFRPFSEPMPNMVAVLSRQFESVVLNAPDYKDKILDVEQQTYQEIVSMICDSFNLSLDKDNDMLRGETLKSFAFTMYDIFVSRFTDNLINFYTSYIVRNMDYIYSTISNNPKSKKARETSIQAQEIYTNSKFSLIHSNLNTIVMNMTTYDIPLHELLTYITDPNTALFLSQFIADAGDIYKNHFACYITDRNTVAGLLTSIKLQLQNSTIEMVNTNVKEEGLTGDEKGV